MSNELTPAPQQQATALAVAVDPNADASPEWRQTLREAEKLAAAPLTPHHLKVLPAQVPGEYTPEQKRKIAWQQTVANCILVANQARRWGADVFAVAAETYVVQNKLGYQGKLIAGIVNSRGGLAQPLQPLYSTGKGDALAAVIYGTKEGEVPQEACPLLEKYADNEDREALRGLARMGVLAIRISVGQAKTKNAMWTNDPEQKLWYSGATKWARRFAPELMLGLLSDDDLERMRDWEQNAGMPAAQSRIGQVIPATLDSGVLPAPPDSQEGKEDEPPFNPPTEAEQAEHPEPQHERQPGADDELAGPTPPSQSSPLEEWKKRIATSDNATSCRKVLPDLIAVADGLTDEEKASLKEECKQRAEAIAAKKRGNGG